MNRRGNTRQFLEETENKYNNEYNNNIGNNDYNNFNMGDNGIIWYYKIKYKMNCD